MVGLGYSAQIQSYGRLLRNGSLAFTDLSIIPDGYVNFGVTTPPTGLGSSGYGFRDNAGVIQYKNSGGAWQSFPTGGSAPDDATYLVQTADAGLPNAQVMGALATGIVKNNTTTGVQSIAVSGVDYFPPRSVQRVVPSTGDSITINTTRNSYLLVVPVATIANLTIVFPLAPSDGDEVSISFGVPGTTAANSSVVTTLTANGNGNSVMAIGASATNNLAAHWRYDSASTTWYKIY